jgi:hypothetical protein
MIFVTETKRATQNQTKHDWTYSSTPLPFLDREIARQNQIRIRIKKQKRIGTTRTAGPYEPAQAMPCPDALSCEEQRKQ